MSEITEQQLEDMEALLVDPPCRTFPLSFGHGSLTYPHRPGPNVPPDVPTARS